MREGDSVGVWQGVGTPSRRPCVHASSYKRKVRCRIERCRSTKGQETYIFVKDTIVASQTQIKQPNPKQRSRKRTERREKKDRAQVNGCLMSKALWSNNTPPQSQ